MSRDSQNLTPMFHIDVTADSNANARVEDNTEEAVVGLLHQLVAGQERQNKLLEELIQQTSAAQRQRVSELGQWKQANPELARRCRVAAETLSQVQNEFLNNLTDEVYDNEECLLDGEYVLNDFVDRFGPRLAHLNGVLQVLSQLSTTPEAPSNPR